MIAALYTFLASLCAALAVGLGGFALYSLYLAPFFGDVASDRKQREGLLLVLRRTVIRKLAQKNAVLYPRKYLDAFRRQLERAGRPHDITAEELAAFQEVGAVLGLLLGLFFMASVLKAPWYWLLVLIPLGFFFPLIWLNDQVTKRLHLITRALPYNIDLLTLSVEAGLDFAAAIGKVVEKGRQGPLADELGIVLKQLKMGKTREEALKDLAARINLPVLSSFVAALIQADRMGTSLGKILRIQSTQMRNDRTQRAEKAAGEAPVKMLFPLIFFIFPTVFIVIFAPIVYSMMHMPK